MEKGKDLDSESCVTHLSLLQAGTHLGHQRKALEGFASYFVIQLIPHPVPGSPLKEETGFLKETAACSEESPG